MLNIRLLTPDVPAGCRRHAGAGGRPGLRAASRRSMRSPRSTAASRAPARPAPSAYELRLTCDGGYVVNQRLRLETAGARAAVASEQQSQMTESRDGKKLRFEHRTTTGGRQTSLVKGEALIGDDGKGEARFTDPEGQSVALTATTLFPVAIARETIRQAKAGESGFDAQFFFGEKVKPPQSVNILIGKLPKRLADVKIPEGGEQLADGRTRIYYRAGFFDAQADGKGQGELGLRDEQRHPRQRCRALRHPRGERRRDRIPHHAPRGAAQARVQVSGPRRRARMSMTPEQAVDRLEELHATASIALREALARFTESGAVPTAEERSRFRYPELCVDWQPAGAVRFTRRAWAKFQAPGRYTTTVTAAALLPPVPAGATASAQRGVRRRHRGRRERPGDSLSLRHRGGRRVHPRRPLGVRAGAPFPDAGAGQCRRRDRRRHLGVA